MLLRTWFPLKVLTDLPADDDTTVKQNTDMDLELEAFLDGEDQEDKDDEDDEEEPDDGDEGAEEAAEEDDNEEDEEEDEEPAEDDKPVPAQEDDAAGKPPGVFKFSVKDGCIQAQTLIKKVRSVKKGDIVRIIKNGRLTSTEA